MSKMSSLLVVSALLVMSSQAQAASGYPDAAQMFANFSESSIALILLVKAVAILIGIYFCYRGLMAFKEVAETGSRTTLKTPIFVSLIGAFLIAYPLTISITTESLALGSNTGMTLSRVPDGGGVPGMSAAIEGVLLFVKLIGHIAFLRGFMILKTLAEGQQARSTAGGAIWHIVGGAMCINILETMAILGSTFAPGVPLGGM